MGGLASPVCPPPQSSRQLGLCIQEVPEGSVPASFIYHTIAGCFSQHALPRSLGWQVLFFSLAHLLSFHFFSVSFHLTSSLCPCPCVCVSLSLFLTRLRIFCLCSYICVCLWSSLCPSVCLCLCLSLCPPSFPTFLNLEVGLGNEVLLGSVIWGAWEGVARGCF